MAPLALLMAWAAVPVLAMEPNVLFNMTFTDMNTFYSQFPLRFESLVANISWGWNSSFSNSSWNSYVPGMVGEGESMSTINASGTVTANHPSLSFTFIGSSVWLLGDYEDVMPDAWANGSAVGDHVPLTLAIDGVLEPTAAGPPDGLLAYSTGLDSGYHIAYALLLDDTTVFKGVTLNLGVQTQA